jgi:hypothetical protein
LELFARELLLAEGFRIVEQLDRGADGGRASAMQRHV